MELARSNTKTQIRLDSIDILPGQRQLGNPKKVMPILANNIGVHRVCSSDPTINNPHMGALGVTILRPLSVSISLAIGSGGEPRAKSQGSRSCAETALWPALPKVVVMAGLLAIGPVLCNS